VIQKPCIHSRIRSMWRVLWPFSATDHQRSGKSGMHSPVKSPLPAKRFACKAAGGSYCLQVAPPWLLSMMSVFSSILRENKEMLYQFKRDYWFDSSKLERAIELVATDYRSGISATLHDVEGRERSPPTLRSGKVSRRLQNASTKVVQHARSQVIDS
jgi:hypothetical protein